MKEFIIFVCTDSTEIFFSKLRSAGLIYNLPSFFTDGYLISIIDFFHLLFSVHLKNVENKGVGGGGGGGGSSKTFFYFLYVE